MILIYDLFKLLDWAIYWIAAVAFRVIFDIAGTDFFTKNQIDEIANRVYIILGVLMLFKVVISAVQYLVNPDTFDDKEKGLAGLLKRTVLTVVFIVVMPAIFEFGMTIQGSILKAIPSIILGGQSADSINDDQIGRDLSFTVLSSFITPREGRGGSVGANGEIHDINSFLEHANDGVTFFGVGGAKYSYMVVISTLSGAFLCYILLSMALDVAKRTIKLGIIRILSPIPISSYIFGKDKFNKFVKTSLQVYADLFIRMAIVYVVIFVIQSLINNNIINVLNIGGGGVANTGNWFRNILVNIALVFGLLMFAKEAPKFVSDLLGLPDVGSGEMAEMFKPAWQRAGGAAGQLINPLRTGVMAARTSYGMTSDRKGHRFYRGFRTAGAALRGAFEGSLDSIQGAMNGDDWGKMDQRYKTRESDALRHTKASQYYRQHPGARRQTRRDAINSFFGGSPVTSEGYTAAANALNTLRSETFTGRAKGEVDKDAGKLIRYANSVAGMSTAFNVRDENGLRPIETVFSYKDEMGNTYSLDYQRLHDLYTKVENSTATNADYTALGFTAGDASTVRNVHEQIGKKNYAEYVRVVVAASEAVNNPNTNAADKAFLEKYMVDKEVLERLDRFKSMIETFAISEDDRNRLREGLKNDPGGFLAGSNKLYQEFFTEAANRKEREQAAQNNGGK